MKSYEASGRTVEDAISAGLAEHGLSIGDVSVEILEEGSKGLFGLFGSREARVRLTLNDDNNHADAMDLFRDSLASKPQRRPAPREEAPRRSEEAPRPQVREAPKPQAPAPRATEAQAEDRPVRAPRKRKPRQPKPQAGQPQATQPAAPAALQEERVLTALTQVEADSPAGIAQRFLQELTQLMGLEITVSIALDQEGHVFATLEGDPQGILIGRRGETLDALQYLTSLNVNKGREDYVRVTIDSEGYRQKRQEALIRLANRMANRARKTGRRVNMEPMNPYERRIFHSALQASPGIVTHSEGEEPNRHVVITPVRDDGADG
ncbi:MAG: KH domain-containing protein [Clostridiales bacterium]|nr:KH domain-containing protein [Clostridiales bacterium]